MLIIIRCIVDREYVKPFFCVKKVFYPLEKLRVLCTARTYRVRPHRVRANAVHAHAAQAHAVHAHIMHGHVMHARAVHYMLYGRINRDMPTVTIHTVGPKPV
jgi:hypothetical protein